MRRTTTVGLAALSAAIVLAGCSKNDTTTTSASTTSGTKAPATTPATSAPGTSVAGSSVPTAAQTVSYSFGSTATADQAKQAAEVMTKRLDNAGYTGSTATVNAAGTGLTITVTGATSAADAKAKVDPLTVSGKLYFRPVVQGPIAPYTGEPMSQKSADILNALLANGVQMIPGSGIPTPPVSEDDPQGTSVLVQPDVNKAVVARWKVGPEQVDATAIADTKVTTYNNAPGVQVVMKSGSPGIDQFNAMAQACYSKQPTCPTNIYTVVFDSLVITATGVQTGAPSFTPFATTGVIIWSPDWTQDKAKAIAAIIKVGELPVPLVAA